MNYSQIKDMALSYADREFHSAIQDRFDNFVLIVEGRINRRLRREGLTAISNIVTTGEQYYALPDNYNGRVDAQTRDSLVATDRQTLKYRTPEKLNDYANIADSSDEVYYTIVNNQLRVWPPQTGSIIELTHYIKVPNLTSSAPNNNISDNDPDCYVFGLLTEINYFVKDYDAAKFADDRFNAAIEEMLINDYHQVFDGTPLQIILENSI